MFREATSFNQDIGYVALSSSEWAATRHPLNELLLHASQQVECNIACRCDGYVQLSINVQPEPLRVGTAAYQFDGLDRDVRGNSLSIGKHGNVVFLLATWSILSLLLLQAYTPQ